MFQLTVKRKFSLIACLCRTRVAIVNAEGEELVELRLWAGQEKTLSLPKQRCTLKASTSFPLLHLIVNTAVCYGDRFNRIQAEIAIVDYNYLAGIVPGLAIIFPLFEYKITMRNEVTADED